MSSPGFARQITWGSQLHLNDASCAERAKFARWPSESAQATGRPLRKVYGRHCGDNAVVVIGRALDYDQSRGPSGGTEVTPISVRATFIHAQKARKEKVRQTYPAIAGRPAATRATARATRITMSG